MTSHKAPEPGKRSGQLDYAVIGNCQVSAVIDKQGKIVWFCVPRFDSQAVFSALVGDDDAGQWSILPVTDEYRTEQKYMANTNIVVTDYYLKNGDAYCVIDFAPRFLMGDRYYHRPQIIRIVHPIKGNPWVKVSLKPKFDYGRIEPQVSMVNEGVAYRGDSTRLILQTDVPVTYVLSEQAFELNGNQHFVLGHGEPFERPLKYGCEEYCERTANYWRTWIKHCMIPFEYQDEVIRSALALKLHIYEDTGAIIAATTTSIPESPQKGRTWDYRYCWLRDAYFVLSALNRINQFEEMEHFIQYLHNISISGPSAELQPLYGIGGEHAIQEQELDWLSGFKGLGPVRIGNGAYTHEQHDVYGEMVLCSTPLFFDQRLDRIDRQRAFENIVQLVEQASKVFDKPDFGIWEFRSERRHFLFSKLLCWVALSKGIKIAEKMGQLDRYPHWLKLYEKMRKEIEKSGWNSKLGYYTQDFKGQVPDASNLLMGALGFHDPNNKKYRSMVEKYEKELMQNGFVFRYCSEDHIGLPSHAFTVCGFWMVDALVQTGRKEEAREIFERILSCSNHVGLLSEHIDPKTGELWGNFPQTYSHVGVINSAFHLSKTWEEGY